jgi:hypothetical protein
MGKACLVVVGGVGEATNATGLPTAARKITQRFGDLTFGISLVERMGSSYRILLGNQEDTTRKTYT